MKASGFMWLALAVVVGVAMFLIKYKVQGLDEQLQAKRVEIAHDRAQIRVLEAEWTDRNDPESLRRLSSKYLGLGPPVPQNVTDIESLPARGAGQTAPANAPSVTRAPPKPPGPSIDAEAAPADTGTLTAFQRPAGLPVFLARLQRLLLPEAVGATTPHPRYP